jgi:hypothetical protein
MSIGFIPSNDNDVQEPTASTTGSNEWLASQVALDWELHVAMHAAYQRLFRAVQQCCLQLAEIDPDDHSAELEEAEVVLRLNCLETLHERLEVLTEEARRLRCTIAEAQRRLANTKSPNSLMRRIAQLRSNFMSGGVRDPAMWAFGCWFASLLVLVLLRYFDLISNDMLWIAWLARYALLGAGLAIALVYALVAWIKETPRAERGRCYRALLIMALVLIGAVVSIEAVGEVFDRLELRYAVPSLLSFGVFSVVGCALISRSLSSWISRLWRDAGCSRTG